jgi:hypothetical protein
MACLCVAAVQDAGRPIRYPAKIAPTLQELMSGVDGVMAGLRQMLKEHMATGGKRLRVQVRADNVTVGVIAPAACT